MTIIVGRLTSDAQVKNIEEGKTVVNFTIALNDYYKPKGSEEAIEYTEFVQCAYWYNSGIAVSLKKGAVVEAGGRLFASAYSVGQEIRPQINMQVQHVKVHAFAKSTPPTTEGGNTNDTVATDSTGTEQQSTGKNNKNSRKRPNGKASQHAAAQQLEVEGSEPVGDLPF